MNRRRTFLCCLALLLAVPLLGASAAEALPYPISDAPVTLRIASMTQFDVDWGKMPLMQEWEQMLGVAIEWDLYPADGAKEKVTLMLASGDYPDASINLGISNADHLLYGQAGAILPLNGLIEQYAPNWAAAMEERPEIRNYITMADGNIYSLPMVIYDPYQYGIRDSMVINAQWLEALGLQAPATLEEFREVLRAFKTRDPNGNGEADEIPFTFTYDGYSGGYYDLFGAFDIVYGGCRYDGSKWCLEDGKVFYGAIDPRVRAGLAYYHELYAEGLIDVEAFTQSGTQRTAKCATVPRIVGVAAVFNGAGEFGVEAMMNGEYVALAPMTGLNGQTPVVRYQPNYVSNNYFTIYSVAEHPDVLMKLANFYADQDIGFQGKNGKYGDLLEENAEGLWQLKEMYVNDYTLYQPLRPENNLPYYLRPETTAKLARIGKDLARKWLYEANAPYVAGSDRILQGLVFTSQEEQVRAMYITDIDNYVKEMHAKFIVEGVGDGEWDAFVQRVWNMNLQKVLDIMQAAQDRFSGN